MNSNFFGCSTGISAGFGILENLVHVSRGAPAQVGKARRIAHQPAVFHEFWPAVYCWHSVLDREICNLSSLGNKHRGLRHEQRISTFLVCGSKWISMSLGA